MNNASKITPSLDAAFCALNSGDYHTAETLFKSVISKTPSNPYALNGLGLSIAKQHGFANGTVYFEKALKIKENFLDAIDYLARAHRELGNLEKSEHFFKKALKISPKNAMINDQLGLTYLDFHQPSKAVPYLKKATKLSPESQQYIFNLGISLLETGKLIEAEKSFRAAIKLWPNDARSYACIGTMKKFKRLDDDDLLAMLRIHSDKNIPNKTYVELCFAIGKAYEDLRDFKKASEYFRAGNDEKMKEFANFNFTEETDRLSQITKIIDYQTISSKTLANLYNCPIFILGMPRSGTSLVEQILCSHKQVLGAGELTTLTKAIASLETAWQVPYPSMMKLKQKHELKQIAEIYQRETSKYSKKTSYFTDKMPVNFQYIGLIAALMPKAKIINLVRSAGDVCLSCYTENFKNNQEFSFSLETQANYYTAYQKLMDHWNNILPKNKIYNISYDDLVNDPETEIRKLLIYCELDWDQNCLSPHKNKRSVSTASVTQVREPLHNKSVERWRNYSEEFKPMWESLKII